MYRYGVVDRADTDQEQTALSMLTAGRIYPDFLWNLHSQLQIFVGMIVLLKYDLCAMAERTGRLIDWLIGV